MSNSFLHPPHQDRRKCEEEGEPKVETLPKHLDEKVAKLHLEALVVELTELTKEQRSTSVSTWRAGQAGANRY